jgi:hypothetical protein
MSACDFVAVANPLTIEASWLRQPGRNSPARNPDFGRLRERELA